MTGNYRALENILRGYWLQPNRARRFYFDFEDRIDELTAEGDEFTAVFVSIKDSRRDGDTVLFNVDIYALDIRTEGGENSLDIVSDTHQLLTDFQSALDEEQINGLFLGDFGTIEAVENGMFDGLDGNKLTGIVLDMDAADYCEAP
jgi:hypothetical protein